MSGDFIHETYWGDHIYYLLSRSAYQEAANVAEANIPLSKEIRTGLISNIFKIFIENKVDCRQAIVPFRIILKNIAQHCPVDDVVLELVDATSENRDTVLLELVLDVFETIFTREEKEMHLDWCFSIIRLTLSKDHLPQNLSYKRLFDFFVTVMQLFSPFSKTVKCLIVSNLLHFLRLNYALELQSGCYRLLAAIIPDPVFLLRAARVHLGLEKKENLCYHLLDREVVPSITFAFYFHYAWTSNMVNHPEVYSPVYLFYSTLPLVKLLLKNSEKEESSRGLELLNFLSLRCNESLRMSFLNSTLGSVMKRVNYIMIYAEEKKQRQEALLAFENIINCFDVKGRYHLILCYRRYISHPGTLAFFISKIKSIFDKCRHPNNNDDGSEFFRGKRLFDLFKMYCFFTPGETPDIVQSAEQIIAALNFFWYLVVLNMKLDLEVGEFCTEFRKCFLNPLQNFIEITRMQCEQQLTDVENGKDVNDLNIKMQLPLPELSKDDKLQSVMCARNAVDVIQLNLDKVMEILRIYSGHRKRFLSDGDAYEGTDEAYEDNIRERILQASLPFVKQHGWSQQALAEGAKAIGYPGVTSGLMQNGTADLIFYFYVNCNKQLVAKMKKDTTKSNGESTQEPHKIVEAAIQTRLRMIVPYVEQWPQALGIMAMPPNVPVALSNLLTLVDDICYYAGDKSVDFNWYSRRIAVCGIYKMTELCLVQDKSKDFTLTWEFLSRRMDEAMSIHNVLQSSGEATGIARDAILATFTTARNILRLNRTR